MGERRSIISGNQQNWTNAMTNKPLDRITVDPAVMNGQACIRGMRLTVRRVLQAVALYPDRAELLREYPELEGEDIQQALEYAASNLDDRTIAVDAA